MDLFVARRPPTARHFVGQRVRQAYDELARPRHLLISLSVLPILAATLARGRLGPLLALATSAVLTAEVGRRRSGGHPRLATVTLLAELANGGPVLEFGIGTGRLALPLARRGIEVSGIDGSAEMLDQLRGKPGGAAIRVVVGDFASAGVDTTFTLVVLVANTVFALPSQDAQVQTIRNAAHLRPGGHLIIEAWVPDVGDFRAGRALRVVSICDRRVVLEAAELDPVDQHMRTTKLFCGPDGLLAFPANHRYAWPAELDLMAQLAGLKRVQRWEDWRRRPYSAASRHHVTVYATSER